MRITTTLLAGARSLALAIGCSALATPAGGQVRVMPLGDSITEGDAVALTTYRCNLWAMLEAELYSVDFVGSKTGAGSGSSTAVCNLSANFDADHEGHSAWKISQVLAHVQANPVSPPPDVVLLHMGVTNLLQDLFVAITQQTGQPPTQQQINAAIANAMSELSALIDELRNQNPNVAILVAQIVPADVLFAGFMIPFSSVELFNDQIPALVAAKDQDDSRVFLVDQHTGYDPVFDSVDGIHPNSSGEVKLANGWFPKLKFVLDSLPCTTSTTATAASSLPPASVSPGDSVTLTATVSGGTGPNLYQWRRNGQPIQGAVNSTLVLPSVTIADEGNYDVVAGNFCSTHVSNGIAIFPIEFAAPVTYAAGAGPTDLIAADVSNPADGLLDLVSANGGADSVTIRVNSGGGVFGGSPANVPLDPGDQPSALAAGGFIAGGGRDLAVACRASDVVRILDSAAGFAETATLSAPAGAHEPAAIAAGDLDGGGDDLAIAYRGNLFSGGGGVAIALGPGATQTAQMLAAPVSGFLSMRGVVIADLDADGDQDVAATMAGTVFSPSISDNVLLWENLGGGAFALAGALSAVQNPGAICAGDLDGDGRVDLAITVETAPFGAPGGVMIFRHTAGSSIAPGSFAASSVFNAGSNPIDLACGDLRDDSIPGFQSRVDLVTANFASANVGIYFGFDGSAFASTSTCVAGLNPTAVVVAELNGDRTPDVAIANTSSGDVTVSLALPRALTQTFGIGCIGTSGTPSISAAGLPSYGSSTFSVQLSSARPLAPTLLGASLSNTDMTLSGCKLVIAQPFVLLPLYTSALGTASMTIGIPLEVTPFQGLSAYFQYFVYDPVGGYQNEIAFSDGLRIKFGNP